MAHLSLIVLFQYLDLKDFISETKHKNLDCYTTHFQVLSKNQWQCFQSEN